VWVGVGLLGRRLLLQCEQRRPDAGVEVYGEPNTNTNGYTYSNAEANSNAEGAPKSRGSPDSAAGLEAQEARFVAAVSVATP
jgi:hypothetical protein